MTDLDRFISEQESQNRWRECMLKDSIYFVPMFDRYEMTVVKAIKLENDYFYWKRRRFGHAKAASIILGQVFMFKIEITDYSGELDEDEKYFVIVQEYGKYARFIGERRLTCDQANSLYKKLKKDGYLEFAR